MEPDEKGVSAQVGDLVSGLYVFFVEEDCDIFFEVLVVFDGLDVGWQIVPILYCAGHK